VCADIFMIVYIYIDICANVHMYMCIHSEMIGLLIYTLVFMYVFCDGEKCDITE